MRLAALRSQPSDFQAPLTPRAAELHDCTLSSDTAGDRADSVLARHGHFGLEIRPLALDGAVGYQISVRNHGPRALGELQLAETLIRPGRPNAATVLEPETPPIEPGTERTFRRRLASDDSPWNILVDVTVLAHVEEKQTLVYRSCRLLLDPRPAGEVPDT